ncbi:MAG: hypothetical protein KF812_04450 [Fimbriimonadaceae bacterium]|nr:hypothetical protein [Fimbriimonadaceae bacterium]
MSRAIHLRDIPTRAPEDREKEATKLETQRLGKRMEELFDLLFFAGQNALLIVFQGMDTAGKDGAIRNVLRYTHAQSVDVVSFKVPTAEELAHDFLWRCHKATPGTGEIVVFNRSHYEDVLVVRVHELVPQSIWEKRYEQINQWESLLTCDRTIMLKFFLHISKEEQEERLLEREQEVEKAWKLSVGDWKERERWDDYQSAYEAVIQQCSPKNAPWSVVPADQKWYRDYVVVKSIVEALEPYQARWMEYLENVGELAKAELAKYRIGE